MFETEIKAGGSYCLTNSTSLRKELYYELENLCNKIVIIDV